MEGDIKIDDNDKTLLCLVLKTGFISFPLVDFFVLYGGHWVGNFV